MSRREEFKVNRKEAAKGKKRKRIILFLSLAVIVVFAGVYFLRPVLENQYFTGTSIDKVDVETEKAIPLSIVCVGDIMVHKPQIASQYDSESGTYNYDNNFQYVKKYIQEADLALCNVETTFAGGTPTGYPSFNAPDALADALMNAGFDVAITSNNHLYDKGLSGMKRTLQILREAGFITTGTRLPEEKNYSMIQVNGLQIAVIAYTYETPTFNGKTTINSAVLSEEAIPLINSFNYETLDEDLQSVENTIIEAKEADADIVVCYYHWGEEYERTPNHWQEYIAKKTAEMGADIIFASHSHVLQRAEMLTVEETGKRVPVFYGMGNFLSNQRVETLNNRFTEQGMIARVQLEYKKSTGEITMIEMDAMQTWMEKYTSGGKIIYTIIPLDNGFKNNEKLIESGHLERAIQASEDVNAVLGDNYIWK
jgi:poly-gamma-glutamate capsule biosynthesis protein CapA/YwtB (metallophosphatase superfamily)